MYNQGNQYGNYSEETYQDDYLNFSNEEVDEEEIRKARLDVFFLCVLIIANVIGILLVLRRIKIIRGQVNKEEATRRIIKDAEIALILVIVSSAYFLYKGWVEYKKNPTDENLSFLIALILIMIALIIRYFTLLKFDSVSGVEDIIG